MRIQSEGQGNRGAGKALTLPKRKACPLWELTGKCPLGDKCKHEHVQKKIVIPESERGEGSGGDVPLRTGIPCIEWQRTGQCKNRSVCRYKHGERATKSVCDSEPTDHGKNKNDITSKSDKPCFKWQKTGQCIYGSKCRYKHGGRAANCVPDCESGSDDMSGSDMANKTGKPCFVWQRTGHCKNGSMCRYKHGGRAAKRVPDCESGNEDMSGSDMTNKTGKPCFLWERTGRCKNGSMCRYKHGKRATKSICGSETGDDGKSESGIASKADKPCSERPANDDSSDAGNDEPDDSSTSSDDTIASINSSEFHEDDVWTEMRPSTWKVDVIGRTVFTVAYLNNILNHDEIDFEAVRIYLFGFPTSVVMQAIKDNRTHEMDPLFFAVAANDVEVVKLLINHGANVNAAYHRGDDQAIPLLAFAIVRGDNKQIQTTEVVRILLAHGADPTVIGKELYQSFKRPENNPAAYFPKNGNQEWCTFTMWRHLRAALNITQKYLLDKASKLPKPSSKRKQVATTLQYEPLFQVPFHLIGQDAAVQEFTTAVFTHGLLRATKPLVVVFAGPSGHGKTELARQMGYLLSLPMCRVDCTEMHHKTDLLGPKAPYQGYMKGSMLNNFICDNAGKPCIVFFDEFEKSGRDVHEALLLPFGEGSYRDQRETANTAIDCSKVIWIIATNCADEEIQRFYAQNEPRLTEPLNLPANERYGLISALEARIRASVLKKQFGAPLTGRITRIIPFFPFSSREQLIVGDKYIQRLKQELAMNISLEESSPFLVGNVCLCFERGDDLAVCQVLVEGEYDRALGARSIVNAIERKVKQEIVTEWLLREEAVDDAENEGPMVMCELGVRSLEGESMVVVLFKDKV